MLPLLLLACSTTSKGTGDYSVDAWADNWFALYVEEDLVAEDSVPITTERSFNSESFSFDATAPFQVAVKLMDYKENDSGLEYIGESNQQMGDGGFILQMYDSSGALVAVTNSDWRCYVIHTAPLDPSCEDDADPTSTCTAEILDEPDGWTAADFDDSSWAAATEHSAADVSPKEGYDDITWDSSAAFIWGSSLTQDNTVLCRVTVE
ncbi:MAG TPA: PEBP family protein [Myxococcota bacterium]|nr:PEBP family protein [Myxococcota bacterium]HND30433.1 PEBP family protein [Myxococcota bacterium]